MQKVEDPKKVEDALEDLFHFYRDDFLRAYADVVAYLADKPKQVLLEIENAFSHTTQAFNPKLYGDQKLENIRKAKNHLARATLDSYKLTWVEMDSRIKKLNNNENMRRYCVNMPEHEFLKKYSEFKDALRAARLEELKQVGVDPLASLEKYEKALQLGKEVEMYIDDSKIYQFNHFKNILNAKVHVISFLLGVIASIVGGYMYVHFFN